MGLGARGVGWNSTTIGAQYAADPACFRVAHFCVGRH